MANPDFSTRTYWKPIIKWIPTFQIAIGRVAMETGVTVPLTRMMAHCDIETGNTGDPNIVSKGANTCCDQYGNFVVGKDCSPDCRAYGLFQIYWHICDNNVDWKNIRDPNYNSYLGAKYLACAFQECGTWPQASNKFFTGSCNKNGTVDNSTGTSDTEYAQGMVDRIKALTDLGYGDIADDPKAPGQTKNGGTNTPTGKSDCAGNTVSIFGVTLCLDFGTKNDPVSTGLSNVLGTQLQTLADNALPRITLIVIGIIMLGIATFSLLNEVKSGPF